MRDYQRSAVYSWQKTIIPDYFKKRISNEEAILLMQEVGSAFGVKKLDVRWHGTTTRGAAYSGRSLIRLPNNPARATVLHEMSHIIAAARGERHGHGAIFVTVFCEVLKRFHNENISYNSALRYGLNVYAETEVCYESSETIVNESHIRRRKVLLEKDVIL